MYDVRLTPDNYDITHNLKVRSKYPVLCKEVEQHDITDKSPWYSLSACAFAEYMQYKADTSLGYVSKGADFTQEVER